MRIIIVLSFIGCLLIFGGSALMMLLLSASSHNVPRSTYVYYGITNIVSLLVTICIYIAVKAREKRY